MSLLVTSKQNSGFALLAVITVMGALLLLTGYFLEQSTAELKISKSEVAASKTYYLAEAGGNEAIYKLKYDPVWKAKFLSGTLNSDTFVRANAFDDNGSYTILTTSVEPAIADITVTAQYDTGLQPSKRIIKTRLARATNPADTWSQSIYAGGKGAQENGNITIERNCIINGGTIHANQNIKVSSQSTLTINDGAITSSNNITVNAGSSLILNNSTRQEGASEISMPQLDFDSSSSTSIKNRANQVYTATAFQNLPSGTVLDGITFVTGGANWDNKNLTINGILAASDDIRIDLNDDKTLTLNSNPTTGSGILGKDDIYIELNNATLNLNGLIYASKNLELKEDTNKDSDINITGGIIGWHTRISGYDKGVCNITYDQTLASQPLDPVLNGSESPIIQVNHWEEEY
jgi:hypothetical protein